MPSYREQWDNIWNPYVTYASGVGRDDAQTVKDRVWRIAVSDWMDSVDIFNGEVERYRGVCRQMHNNSTYTTRAQVDDADKMLRLRAQEFQASAKRAQQQLNGAANAMHNAADEQLFKTQDHKLAAYNVVEGIRLITNRLKADQETYGPRIQKTLEDIRRNP